MLATPSAFPATDAVGDHNMTITMKGFMWRGLAAGAVAGLVWGLYLRFVLETQIGFALQFEDAAGLGAPAGEASLFSRATQQAGGMVGALLYGVVLGIVLAVTVAALHHRIAAHNEFGRAARVAAGIFVAMILIPLLKYPPNPPTVGNPDTVNQRTSDFLLLMGASIVLVFIAFFAWQWFADRGSEGATRFLAVVGGLGLVVVALYAIWPPSPDAVVPPNNEAAPALVVAADAPTQVLDQMLASARVNGDQSLRDSDDPTEPLDLTKVKKGSELAGVPFALSTTRLVDHSYASVIWHFRIESIGGYVLFWAVLASAFGFLADYKPRASDAVSAKR